MRDVTLADVERLGAEAGANDVAFDMDEASFRGFYDRTARPLWGYLARLTGDPHLADDLLQESYYRLLRVHASWEGEAHRRAYLFRIATNLVRDRQRRARPVEALPDGDTSDASVAGTDPAESYARRTDLHRAWVHLNRRERALLWLAYACGQPHVEIARVLGVRAGSVKLLLFRARRKLAGLLRSGRPAQGTD